MTEKNSQNCQNALEKNQKCKADFEKQAGLPTIFNQSSRSMQNVFRSLTLLINKANANVDELRTTLDDVLKENPNSCSTSSVMERHSNLLSHLEKFEHEVDSLDDDGLLSQSSTRIRDDVSVTTNTTARCPTTRRCSPSMNENSESCNPEFSSFSNKTSPLPPRPEKPSLFLSECHKNEPMLSKFLNGNNENPPSIGMSTASLLRQVKIGNTADAKTGAKHSDKKLAKPEMTVAETTDRFSDTTFSAADHFTVSHQQPETNTDSCDPLNVTSTQIKFQNHFPQENINKHFQSKNILSFDLTPAKQPFELSNTMTNFNQFSESSCQNPNHLQTSILPSLQLHNGQKFKNTQNKILPGNFTPFQPESQVQPVGIEPLNPFGVQQTTCSKPLTAEQKNRAMFSRGKTRAKISTFTSIFKRITSIIK